MKGKKEREGAVGHNALRKRSKIGSIWGKNVSGWVLLLPSILFFVFIVWRPILIGISYSFFKLEGFTPVEFVGLQNFKEVLSDTNFIQTFQNTVMYVIWSLIMGFLLPVIIAVLINELVYAKGFVRVGVYLPAVIPGIAVYMIWRMIYGDSAAGLLNTFIGYLGFEHINWLGNQKLVIPLIVATMTWSSCGATAVFYIASLQSVNNELYEATRLDGAGVIARVRYVLIPHLRGIMLLSFVRQIIAVFNVTEQPLTMTGGGPNGASLSLGLTNYYYAFKYGQ